MSTHSTMAAWGDTAQFAGRHCPHELLWGTCCWCPTGTVHQTFPPSKPTLHATVVVTAWYPTLCRNPGCGRRSDVGDPVGLVAGMGPCCAACTGLRPDSQGSGDQREWVA